MKAARDETHECQTTNKKEAAIETMQKRIMDKAICSQMTAAHTRVLSQGVHLYLVGL